MEEKRRKKGCNLHSQRRRSGKGGILQMWFLKRNFHIWLWDSGGERTSSRAPLILCTRIPNPPRTSDPQSDL